MKTPHCIVSDRSRRAFSLVELVIVVIIIGILAAIALPRASNAAEAARANAFVATINSIQAAVDHYTAEHADRGPAIDESGSLDTSGANLIRRLIQTTDENGDIAGTIYGPYLGEWPTNSLTGKKSVRIDGAPAGANTHGWRYDSLTGAIESDHRTVDVTATLSAIIAKGLRRPSGAVVEAPVEPE